MIVPSMTYDEMRNEFMHDYHIAKAKTHQMVHVLVHNMQKRHQKNAIETITWQSSLHNTWMSFYKLDITGADCFHVCITMDRSNLAKTLSTVILDSSRDHLNLVESNIHFYKRYNERMKLNLPKPLLIIKHYFKHNLVYNSCVNLSKTDQEATNKVFFPVTGGVMLGYQYTSKNWIEAKTFISDEMLRESQMEKVEYLKNYKLDGNASEQHPPAL